MAKKYRVGVACMSHDHVWGELANWQRMDNVELVAGGDDEAHLLEELKQKHGVTRLYDSFQAMLDSEELDIVQAAGGNNEGAAIVEAAAAKGLHIISEKPMAATLEQADRMLSAAQKAGVLLLINWPNAWSAAWQELARRALAGDIGEIRYTALPQRAQRSGRDWLRSQFRARPDHAGNQRGRRPDGLLLLWRGFGCPASRLAPIRNGDARGVRKRTRVCRFGRQRAYHGKIRPCVRRVRGKLDAGCWLRGNQPGRLRQRRLHWNSSRQGSATASRQERGGCDAARNAVPASQRARIPHSLP